MDFALRETGDPDDIDLHPELATVAERSFPPIMHNPEHLPFCNSSSQYRCTRCHHLETGGPHYIDVHPESVTVATSSSLRGRRSNQLDNTTSNGCPVLPAFRCNQQANHSLLGRAIGENQSAASLDVLEISSRYTSGIVNEIDPPAIIQGVTNANVEIIEYNTNVLIVPKDVLNRLKLSCTSGATVNLNGDEVGLDTVCYKAFRLGESTLNLLINSTHL